MTGPTIINLAVIVGIVAVIVTAIIVSGFNRRAELRAQAERRRETP
ncbi:hypothetical protein NE235_10620 [Actinoallomurus spadix]|uniref:Uncharacterized protein n=1 Tax=Actinoallomurus spadix TaxID=79912 RepID=A0ABN0WVF3_9ACTN|nr:hypothetical protein [Actinoallomurus spadix]MCO5986555.1 hypothetical protein [Actinoallomurus spadix]